MTEIHGASQDSDSPHIGLSMGSGDGKSVTARSAACLNCGQEAVRCEDADCWHHGHAEPYVHGDTGSHYCHLDSADNMVAEVDR